MFLIEDGTQGRVTLVEWSSKALVGLSTGWEVELGLKVLTGFLESTRWSFRVGHRWLFYLLIFYFRG